MRTILSFIAILALSITAAAQAPTTGGVVFSTTAEATALNYNGTWGPAAHTTESFDLIDWGMQKGNSLNVEGHQLVSTPFNAYLGGVKFVPDISSLISKTNIQAGSLSVFLQGAGGVSTFTTGNHVAFLAGGGLSYRATPNLQWSALSVHFLRVGSRNAIEMSTGIAYFFNPQVSQSVAIKKMIARRAMAAQR